MPEPEDPHSLSGQKTMREPAAEAGDAPSGGMEEAGP